MLVATFLFSSVLAQTGGAWRVESRPLETAPYDIQSFPLHKMRTELTHWEGSAQPLAAGDNTIRDFAVSDAGEHELELQLAYLMEKPFTGAPRSCRIELELTSPTGETQRSTQEVPLRSLASESMSFEGLSKAYDWLMPAVRLPLTGAGTWRWRARLPSACPEGQVFIVDPKVWVYDAARAPHRLVLIISDAIGADWVENGQNALPALREWFNQPGATFSSNVASVGTNTGDATLSIFRMRSDMRESAHLTRGTKPTGLVPAFLNHGYEVLGFNSNLYLTSGFYPTGFRNLLDFDAGGPNPVSKRHVEMLPAMTQDWLRRHPKHDVLSVIWLTATHHGVFAPGVPVTALPTTAPARQERFREMQRQTLAYTDAELAKALSTAPLSEADVFFFSDHGLNYRTLEHPEPVWGRCSERPMTANNHLEPDELRVPIGARVRGHPIAAPAFEVSSLDWVYTVIKLHNPAVLQPSWEGQDLLQASEQPRLSTSSYQRGAVRFEGRHLRFQDATCRANDELVDVVKEDGTRAEPAERELVVEVLAERGLLSVERYELSVVWGASPCRVFIDAAAGRGVDHHELTAEGGWYTTQVVHVQQRADKGRAITLRAEPAGCLAVQAGPVRRTVRDGFELNRSGVFEYSALPANNIAPAAEQSVMRLLRKGEFRRTPAGWEPVNSANESNAASTDVRAMMKRWGYIHDEEH